ncbi:hypothetical protein [Methanimicrococcus hongohii]|nr:hypothetical protein [Methanimicrococcus sp. Hf6]
MGFIWVSAWSRVFGFCLESGLHCRSNPFPPAAAAGRPRANCSVFH